MIFTTAGLESHLVPYTRSADLPCRESGDLVRFFLQRLDREAGTRVIGHSRTEGGIILGADAIRPDAGRERRDSRSGQARWRLIVHLNRAGLPDAVSTTDGERVSRWEYRVYPRSSGGIGDIVFRFDEGNPHSRARDARHPNTLVLCLCDPHLELSSAWFAEQFRTALKPHRWPEGEGMADAAGQALLEATNTLLQRLAESTPSLVKGLLGPAASRRFEIQGDAGASYGFQLGEAGALRSDRGTMLLHRWWLFMDHVCTALRKDLAAFPATIPGQPLDARTRLANLLKLRAHLAANLLESESPVWVSVSGDHVARYHSSLIEWVRFNLESRTHDEDLDHLGSRYRELGDVLFMPKPSTSWIRAVRWVGRKLFGLTSDDYGHWATTRYFALREAFVKARDVAPPAGEQREGDDQKSLRGRILDDQWRALHAAEACFGSRYELREVMILSGETANVWRQARKEDDQEERRQAFLKDLLRSVPWPIMSFLVIVAISWLAFFASEWGWPNAPSESSPLSGFTRVLFTAQYGILYSAAAFIAVLAVIPMQRIHSLFQQALPRIFGGIIFGYSLFSFTEEMWWLPLKMSWLEIAGVTLVLVAVSSLYFVFEVAGKVRRKEQIMRKAVALLLVAFAQAYGIGMIVTDVLGPHLIMPSIYKEVAGKPDFSRQQGRSNEAGAEGRARSAQVRSAVPGPHEDWQAPAAAVDATGVPAVPAADLEERGLRALLEDNGELHILEVPILWRPELWFFPKLLTLWIGLALFFGIFVQILWQKEGILERLSREATN